MITYESLRNIPTGEAKKVAEIASQRSEQLVIFSPVANTVERVNSEIHFPFELKPSLPTNLGRFAHKVYREQSLNRGDGLLEYWSGHHRSAVLGRMIFADKTGSHYRDVDQKGGGLIIGDLYATLIPPGEKLYNNTRGGLLDFTDADHDYQMAESFHSFGLRVVRPIAIVKLQELIVRQTKVTVEQALKMGIIDSDTDPVLLLRAYGVRSRLIDVQEPDFLSQSELQIKKRNRILIDDAKAVLSAELRTRAPLSDTEYFDWFLKTHAENVGQLHKLGYYHHWLTAHNITLDCRMLDFDDTKKLETEEERRKEYENMKDNCTFLAAMLEVNPFHNPNYEQNKQQIEKRIEQMYDKTFTTK